MVVRAAESSRTRRGWASQSDGNLNTAQQAGESMSLLGVDKNLR